MTERDDDRFRPQLRPPRERGNGESVRFVSRVLKAVSRAGPRGVKAGRRPDVFAGRGKLAARLALAQTGVGQLLPGLPGERDGASGKVLPS